MWIRRFIWSLVLIVVALPLSAQDGLNLPRALFVLTAEGQVDRYGLGAEGVLRVTPEEDFVIDFGVAPDGNWLAYRTETALLFYNFYTTERVQIDGALAGVPPYRGQGDSIAWSSGGDALAVTTVDGGRVYLNAEDDMLGNAPFEPVVINEGPFIQWQWSPDGSYLAGESENDVWWFYRREASQMILHGALPSVGNVTWIGPGEVVFTPIEGGLRSMDLNNANTQAVLLDDTWDYSLPYPLPDGTLAVFGRQKDETEFDAGYARLYGLPPDEARIDSLSELAVELADLYWSPGGDLMVTFRGGALALVNPASGEGFPLPISSVAAYSWGPQPIPRVDGLQLPAAGYFLGPDETGITQIWRLPPDGSPPETLTAEESGVTSFGLAPNAQAIAYSSGTRLMVQRLNGSAAVQVAELSSATAAHPAFSQNGLRVAYTDGGIWVVPSAGGEAQQVIADDATEGFERSFDHPRFAPNVEALLVEVERPEITVPGVVDTTSGELLEVAVEQEAQWLADGRVALYGLTDGVRPGGLSIAGLGSLNQPAQFLPEIISVEALREISTNRLSIVLPRQLVGPRTLRVASLDVGQNQIAPVHTGGFMIDSTISPDGTYAAGYVYREGPLTFRNLSTGEQIVLTGPDSTWDFVWVEG